MDEGEEADISSESSSKTDLSREETGAGSNEEPWWKTNINKRLLVSKGFYFFLYAAIGSLYPYLVMYLKHLWLSASQAGFLFGLKPLFHFIAAPFWAALGDKYKKCKEILLLSLFAWLLTAVTITVVPPGEKPAECFSPDELQILKNNTVKDVIPQSFADQALEDKSHENLADRLDILLDFPKVDDDLKAEETSGNSAAGDENVPNLSKKSIFLPQNIDQRAIQNVKGIEHSSIKTSHTFMYLVVIFIVGHLFTAPAQTLADTVTLQALGDETHKYGLQRYFGSLGWGVGAFGVGSLLSLNHDPTKACRGLDDINYTPSFYAFSCFVVVAFVISSFFKFDYTKSAETEDKSVWVNLREALGIKNIYIIFIALYCGSAMGLIQGFLFWHLHELGGKQFLFSLVTLLNFIGDMVGFLFSSVMIQRIGHVRVIYLGLVCYAVRLFVYGIVSNPWAVLPVEILKGFTASGVWAASISFVGVTPGAAATLQSLIHGAHWGLGYAIGGAVGGLFVHFYGAANTFLGYGFFSIFMLILFILINNFITNGTIRFNAKEGGYAPLTSEE